ncbi:unnamed protein product [Urochloa humidicola]
MEGNGGGGGGGGGGAAPPWDLGMQWAPAAGSPYSDPPPPTLVPRPGGGATSRYQQQQELTCLKLGKRPCCWAGAAAGSQGAAVQAGAVLLPLGHGTGGGAGAGGASGAAAVGEGRRKEKAAAPAPASAAAVARCQVQGCQVELSGAKEYHRRHKVCEAHSKAPRVVVLGSEQRFCQQCSRFHAISEFDDQKRSCRRRLAGHNQRRRKSNASEAMARGAAHPHGMPAFGHGFLPPYGLPASPAGALSLLSSATRGAGGAPWPQLVPAAPDISARSSAALDELIAENRAALLAWQFCFSPDRRLAPPADHQQAAAGWRHHHHDGAGSGRYYRAGHTTLDLMQTAAPAASAGAPLLRPVPERAAAARPPAGGKDGGDAAGGCSLDAWAHAGRGGGGARAL